MVDTTLKDYIKNTIKQGYELNAIRTRLLQSGYSSQEISQAIKEVTERKIISTKTLAITALIIIFLIIIAIVAIKLLTPEPKQINISTTPLVSTVVPGGKLTFVNTITSPTSKTATAELKHTVISTKTGQITATKPETILVGQKTATQTQITLPEDTPPGQHEVITTLTHKDGSKQTSFNFIVEQKRTSQMPSIEEPKPEATPECPQGCDDYNECTQDRCITGTCEHVEIIPCCGNGRCEQGEDKYNCAFDCKPREETADETTRQAIIAARTDPKTATMLCNSQPSVRNADECFASIAEKSSTPEFCESIQADELKDSCLINFALAGNFGVCDEINDPHYLQSCYSLQRQADLRRLTKEFS